jgi:molybdate/tungstate transport system permease protein
MGFKSVDPELEWTARSLGASASYTFFKITLPLMFPYIARGLILSFARSLSEVGAILIIAYYPKSVPILIYERFENFGLKKAIPITSFVILISLFIFSIIMFLERKKLTNNKPYVF